MLLFNFAQGPQKILNLKQNKILTHFWSLRFNIDLEDWLIFQQKFYVKYWPEFSSEQYLQDETQI